MNRARFVKKKFKVFFKSLLTEIRLLIHAEGDESGSEPPKNIAE